MQATFEGMAKALGPATRRLCISGFEGFSAGAPWAQLLAAWGQLQELEIEQDTPSRMPRLQGLGRACAQLRRQLRVVVVLSSSSRPSCTARALWERRVGLLGQQMVREAGEAWVQVVAQEEGTV